MVSVATVLQKFTKQEGKTLIDKGQKIIDDFQKGKFKELTPAKNLLKVHNRNHPLKREYVEGEKDMKTNKEKRKSNTKWMNNHQVCEYNLHHVLGQNQNKFTRLGEDDG